MIAVLLGAFTAAFAQKPAVQWKFSAKKIADKTYELHMTATVPAGWHLYSQFTGEGPVPTSFTFTKNPLLNIQGKVKEVGKMISVDDKVFNNKQKYFSGKVDFVQVVQLKSNVKTNITGEVEYMICDDKQCLPPTAAKFNVALK
jgi:Disulphide bond corrector protein DsbC